MSGREDGLEQRALIPASTALPRSPRSPASPLQRLQERHQVLHLAIRQRPGAVVLPPPSAPQRVAQGRRSAIVEEGRAMGDAAQARHLDRVATELLRYALVAGEPRVRVTAAAPGDLCLEDRAASRRGGVFLRAHRGRRR